MGYGDKMILDFNSKDCEFKLKDVSEYNSKVIMRNIEKYIAFNNKTVLSRDFDIVYKTAMFQISLSGKDTATLDNLLFVYNLISTQLVKDKRHMLNKKQFKRELKRKGYSFETVTKMNEGHITKEVRVYKKEVYGVRSEFPKEDN